MAVLTGKEHSWSIYIPVDIKHDTTEHHSYIFVSVDRHGPSCLHAVVCFSSYEAKMFGK